MHAYDPMPNQNYLKHFYQLTWNSTDIVKPGHHLLWWLIELVFSPPLGLESSSHTDFVDRHLIQSERRLLTLPIVGPVNYSSQLCQYLVEASVSRASKHTVQHFPGIRIGVPNRVTNILSVQLLSTWCEMS